jgi:hypothetical protein
MRSRSDQRLEIIVNESVLSQINVTCFSLID